LIQPAHVFQHDLTMSKAFRFIALFILMSWSAVSHAQGGPALQNLTDPAIRPGNAGIGTAAEQAATMTGGRVLDVEPDHSGDQPRYKVKVLTGDGRVRVVPVDGAPAAGFRN
jgi:hypothetical protein